ncbi:MAG: alkaline phosphatase family protein, partial [Firmicutes bacterium]|nr:alkaline phosphatase family protein [Bacillota bacterium]
DRILVPSPKVATYDLQPEMSAPEVKAKVIEEIKATREDGSSKYDVIILNFANSDMVGHTGVMEAAIKAVETLNGCVKEIVDAILEVNGQLLITADHGNSDMMLDKEGNPFTAHTTNPVPLCYVSRDKVHEFNEHGLSGEGKLADLAPTLLYLMGIDIPEEMTGEVLMK